jgi:hypothetical protein
MKTETNNPLPFLALLSHPFRFIPFSIILPVQGVSKHHSISFHTGVAEKIFPLSSNFFQYLLKSFFELKSSCDARNVRSTLQSPTSELCIQFCQAQDKLYFSFFLGLTVQMMMPVMDDTEKNEPRFIYVL